MMCRIMNLDTSEAATAEVARLRKQQEEIRVALRGYRDSDLVSLAEAVGRDSQSVAQIDELLGRRRRPAESIVDAVKRLIEERP
jgi:hypothetical protein